MKCPDFKDLICKYDVVCVTETKLDDIDVLNVVVPKFKFIPLNRKKFVHKSGGIGVFIRHDLYDDNLISILPSQFESVLLFKFSEKLFGFEVIGGVVYFEPEGTKYANANAFELLENQLITYCDKPLFLVGDFNARTKLLEEFISVDRYNLDLNDDPVSVARRAENESLLEEYGIPRERYSQDKSTNNYGLSLIDSCKNLGVVIANGRVGNDAYVGKLTCRDASVVDYCIASPEVFPRFLNFKVLDFNECFSDVHCGLHIALKTDLKPPNKVPGSTPKASAPVMCKPKWQSEFIEVFRQNIDCDRVDELCNIISELDSDPNVSQNDINNVYDEIKQVLHNSAVKCGSIKYRVPKNSCNTSAQVSKTSPWWNNVCEKARKDFNVSRNNWLKARNDAFLAEKKRCNKAYKKAMNSAIRSYYKDLHAKLRVLKSTNPKEYWAIINKGENCQNAINQISCESFAKHFKKLFTVQNGGGDGFSTDELNYSDTSPLNNLISEEEVKECIKRLKNGKACGYDHIINEFLKHSAQYMLKLYTKFFNLVLRNGIIPDDWVIGIIKPQYKNRGSKNDADNYRGITLLSCMGKLFTFLLNVRLTQFVDANQLMCEEQTGFRNKYSTLDHIFSLNFIVRLYLSKNKRLYCAFVDYRKAFDLVDRVLLWRKLVSMGVNGLFLRVVHNLYARAKSCVKTSGSGDQSSFFASNVGVRQGENLSPLLFALFLTDLVPFLAGKFSGLTELCNVIRDSLSDEEVEVYMKLYVLLYADDTIVLAESPQELQTALNAMHAYCNTNKLTINAAKTKVLIFSRGMLRNIPQFVYNGVNLEVVTKYCYLGLTFNYNGRFNVAQKALYDKASRAMFGLLAKCRKLYLPIDLQIKLFDSVVKPVAIYASEVWGAEDNGLADKLQRRFLKLALGLKIRTPTVMVRGETGCFPVEIDVKLRMLSFWCKLLNEVKSEKISKTCFSCMVSLYNSNAYVHPWIESVKSTLDSLGLTYAFHLDKVSPRWLKCTAKEALRNQYIQKWSAEIQTHEKCTNYKLFKSKFQCESYLTVLPSYLARSLLLFRVRNSLLPVSSFDPNVLNTETRCKFCGTYGPDEFHYLMSCKYFSVDRKKCIGNNFVANILDFKKLMSNPVHASSVALFTHILAKKLKLYA